MKMLRQENKYEVYLKIKFEILQYVGHGENVFFKLMTTWPNWTKESLPQADRAFI